MFIAYFRILLFLTPYVGEWTIPTVTGDIPPPLSGFSFTQVSSLNAIMFGGSMATFVSSEELYLTTVDRDIVVCENWWWLSFD